MPARAVAGNTFARFRLSASGGLTPTGLAEGGEVEDYALTILNGSAIQTVTLRTESVGNHEWSLSDGQLNLNVAGSVVFAAPASRIGQVRGELGGSQLYVMREPAINLLGKLGVDVPGRNVTLSLTGLNNDFANLTSNAFMGVGAVKLESSNVQTLRFSAGDLAKLNSAANVFVHTGTADSLLTSSTWLLNDRQLRGGQLYHEFRSNGSTVWVNTAANWQNAVSQFDVSGDGGTSPIDALLVINYLNRLAGTGGNQLPTFDPAQPKGEGFVDVNGDNLVTAIDALLVINRLNAEGEE